MTTQHTPGPWVLAVGLTGKLEVETANPVRFNNITAGTPIICDVWRHEDAENFSGLANARLIAGAPALLESLREMVICFERFEDTHTALVMDAARAAIAKATGGAV